MFSSPEMTKKFVDFGVEEDLGSDHNIITATFTQLETHRPKPQSKLETHKQHNNNTNGQPITGQHLYKKIH